MATRFGATPAHTYATKVKWLVGCLVSLIALLIVAFVIVAESGQAVGSQTQAPAAVEPVQQVNPGIEVVVAQNRIEEGTRLEPFMFTSVQMEESKVPMGVVRKQDLEKVSGQFASRLIAPNVPVVLEDITNRQPINLLNIPPGYRAVTITVDARSGVEGFAKPNTRVDVLWTFSQDSKQKVATIVRFTKILSVGGMTAADRQANVQQGGSGATTVTLLVSEKDAKKIELARTLGTLSLSLVGDQEEGSKEADPDAITIADLTNSGVDVQAAPQEVASDGVMYTTDPKTGRQIRYILSKSKKWTQDRTFGEATQ
ncbi:MAG: Flp pilus assembly protein CpaB [Bdellovibrionota bacterium]